MYQLFIEHICNLKMEFSASYYFLLVETLVCDSLRFMFI